jgi:hypothetical protein
VPAFHFLRRGIEQARGGAIDDGDLAFAVEPITPALTPDSTASVKRRRASIWWLASISSRALHAELLPSCG